MTITIDPFVAGIAVTLVAELIAIVVFGVVKNYKDKKKRR